MEKSEFIKRTGFDPMEEEYKEIEQLYYDFKGVSAIISLKVAASKTFCANVRIPSWA